jgi:hypothetical protein
MVKNAAAAAVMAFAGAAVLSAVPASAASIATGVALPALEKPSAITLVIGRNYPYRWYYTGPRLRYRHGPFIYYFGGWWYPRPWWHGPGEAYARRPGTYRGYWTDYEWAEGDYTVGTDEHIEWCFGHYRSYDPDTDSFMGRDGERHPCRSPFD